MWPQCLPPTLGSILGFGSRCGFKIFKMTAQVAILDSQTERFMWFWISMSLQCFPSSFRSIQLSVWEEISFEEFQYGCHGGHLGYQNGTILAILNLYVAPMPPIKFWLTRNYGLGWRPSWISERNYFWLSRTYGLGGDVVWRISRWRHCGHLGYRNGTILAILISVLLWCLPSSFGSIRLTIWEEMSFEEFQDCCHYLGYRNGTILAIFNPLSLWCLPSSFS